MPQDNYLGPARHFHLRHGLLLPTIHHPGDVGQQDNRPWQSPALQEWRPGTYTERVLEDSCQCRINTMRSGVNLP